MITPHPEQDRPAPDPQGAPTPLGARFLAQYPEYRFLVELLAQDLAECGVVPGAVGNAITLPNLLQALESSETSEHGLFFSGFLLRAARRQELFQQGQDPAPLLLGILLDETVRGSARQAAAIALQGTTDGRTVDSLMRQLVRSQSGDFAAVALRGAAVLPHLTELARHYAEAQSPLVRLRFVLAVIDQPPAVIAQVMGTDTISFPALVQSVDTRESFPLVEQREKVRDALRLLPVSLSAIERRDGTWATLTVLGDDVIESSFVVRVRGREQGAFSPTEQFHEALLTTVYGTLPQMAER